MKPNFEYLTLPDVLTVYCDRVILNTRTDGNYLFSVLQDLPDGKSIEQSRIMFSTEHIKRVIEILCKGVDYYPKAHKVKPKA